MALAPGSARRRALDAALAELEEQAQYPSPEWRRHYSLLLGLERVLSDEEPRLADGTVLSAHQVDALSGTLTALLAEAERSVSNGEGNGNGNGRAAAAASPELLASAAILGAETGAGSANGAAASELAEREDEQGGAPPVGVTRRRRRRGRGGRDEDEEEEQDEEEEEEELGDLEDELEPLPESEEPEEETEESEEEPRDWVDEDEEEALPDQPEDPNAAKRFWFEHATGAGKTVAALGFVEASQTGGVLILTHRRNLVDQFLGELRDARLLAAHLPPAVQGRGLHEGPRVGRDLPVVRAQRRAASPAPTRS